jgi:hypothetical protein
MSDGSSTGRREPGDRSMGRTYAGVIVLWAITLIAVWMFQGYFGS